VSLASVTADSMGHSPLEKMVVVGYTRRPILFYGNQLLKIQVFRDVMLFCWSCGERHWIESYSLHLQDQNF